MAEELTTGICVIGAGPGGIAAARVAAAAGVSVVLVEKGCTGGNNLTSGAVPAKALLAAASVYDALRAGPALGVSGAPLQVNLPRLREHIVDAMDAIGRNVSPERLAAQGIKVVAGSARFANPHLIVADNTSIRARHVILAIGSVPAMPAIPGLDDVELMRFADGFDLTRRPSHLLVLGAGRYALEFAQAYARLGIDTTVIDQAPALPDDDPELAAIVVNGLRAEGISVRAEVKIAEIGRRRGGIRASIVDPVDGEVAIDASHILVASGRTPAVDGLGLAAAGIDWNAAGIVVDRNLRTTNRQVYAIGDAVAGPPLAMRAEQQGMAVVRAIRYRMPAAVEPADVPSVAFTDPALAAVGLSEQEARLHHRDIRVLRFPFIENDRAHIEHRPAGVIKVIATAGGGRILGAAIVGRDAGELIAPWSLAVANRLGLAAMEAFIPPYPTRSEIGHRVVAGAGMPSLRQPGPQAPAAWLGRVGALFGRFG